MIIPIRCYTCNKVIGNRYEAYLRYLEDKMTPADALDKLLLKRYCCRRMILTHQELIDKMLTYDIYTPKHET